MHPSPLQLGGEGGEGKNFKKVFAREGSGIFIFFGGVILSGGGGSRNFEVKIETAQYQYKEYFWNN